MTIRIVHEEILRASPQAVFALIDDFSRTPEWSSSCGSLEKVGHGPNAPGDRLKFKTREAVNNKASVGHFEGRILERVPGERLRYVIESQGMKSTMEYRIIPVSRGTRIQFAIEMEPRNWLVRIGHRLMGRTIRQAVERMAAADLNNIGALLEDEPGA